MSNAVLEELKANPELPSPTGVALRVVELSRDENSTLEQIAHAIELDPALSAKVLQMVNSPFAGAPRHVASVSHAASLLGVRALAGLALSFSLVSGNRRGRCKTFDYARFWSRSLARAVAARHTVMRTQKFSPDEAFCCGLLSDIGRLALATVFPDAYAAALQNVADDDLIRLYELERAIAGIDHVELSAAMLRGWHFPEVFCNAIFIGGGEVAPTSYPDRSQVFSGILRLCELIAEVLVDPDRREFTGSRAILAANSLGVLPSALNSIVDSAAEEWRATGQFLEVTTHDVPPFAEILAEARERRDHLEQTSPSVAPTVHSHGSLHVRG